MSTKMATLMGQLTVVNRFALPPLIYLLTILDNTPKTILDRINKMIFEFIWEGKPDKIKRAHTIQSYEKGALKLTDMQSTEVNSKVIYHQTTSIV